MIFMTWVKICGITNLEDALLAVDAGADALGFVFYENSPRKVEPELAKQIAKFLPEHVERIGVFVGDLGERMIALAGDGALTGFQVHLGLEGHIASFPTTHCANSFARPPKFLVAFPAARLIDESLKVDFASFAGSSFFDRIVIDSGTSRDPGGTGKTFDWQTAVPIVSTIGTHAKVVIGGGLNPENVMEAIHTLRPWGVDVSSGVEARPGKKDPKKVRAFIAAVRQTEESA